MITFSHGCVPSAVCKLQSCWPGSPTPMHSAHMHAIKCYCKPASPTLGNHRQKTGGEDETDQIGLKYIYTWCLRETWECLWPATHQEAEKHQETDLHMETQYHRWTQSLNSQCWTFLTNRKTKGLTENTPAQITIQSFISNWDLRKVK